MESLDEIKNESRCLSDRVINYLQYGEKKLGIKLPNEILEFYKDMRIDGYFSSGNPKSNASTLLYIGAIVGGFNVTQEMVTTCMEISTNALRRGFKKLRPLYQLWHKNKYLIPY